MYYLSVNSGPRLLSPETTIMSTEPAAVANRRPSLLPKKGNFLKRVNLSELVQRVTLTGRGRTGHSTDVQRPRLPSPLHQPRRSSKIVAVASSPNREPQQLVRTTSSPNYQTIGVAHNIPMGSDGNTSAEEQMVCKHYCADLNPTIYAVLMMGVRQIMPGRYLNTYVKLRNSWTS